MGGKLSGVSKVGATGATTNADVNTDTADTDAEEQLKKQQKLQELNRLSDADVAKIKLAIKEATTLDEVARLERMLRSGRIPQ